MICRGRLLIDDSHPWHDVPDGREHVAAEVFGPLGFTVMNAASLTEHLMPTLESLISAGDVVVLPLMSGGLLAEGVEHLCVERDARLVALHTSKHPFVTLSGDHSQERDSTLGHYEAGALTMEVTMNRVLAEASRATSGESVHVVFVDSNSARGRDALVLRRWLQARTESRLDFTFVVAINETTDAVDHAPGWRAGAKDLAPDAWAIRLVGSTTAYLSHLRFLGGSEAEQFDDVRTIRSRFPALTRFWDTLPPDLAAIHGHRTSTLTIHRERTHVRLPREDIERVGAILDALARLDRRAPASSTLASGARRRRLLELGGS